MTPNFDAQPIALLSPAVGTENVGDHFIDLAIRRMLRDDVAFERFSIRQPLADADIEAINRCSCALLCGTNLYQHDWHSKLTPQMLDRIKVPVIPFGLGGSAQSVDQIAVSTKTADMIRALHAHCTLGGVRDPHGAAVVSSLGISNYALTACPVLYWSGRAQLPPIAGLPRKRIVLTARNWLMHHWPDNVDHPHQVQFIRTILSHFAARDLVFAIHEQWDERLIDLAGIPRQIIFRSDRAQDYIDLYTDPANVVLAMRLHAGMLAVANGVPAVFVGHDSRTYSFCQMMDIECIELFADKAAEKCIDALQRLCEGQVESFVPMRRRFLEVRAGMLRFLQVNRLPARQFREENSIPLETSALP